MRTKLCVECFTHIMTLWLLITTLWRLCYSFPHPMQFHLGELNAGTVSWSRLCRVLTVGLGGSRALFGWLRRLLPEPLGESLSRPSQLPRAPGSSQGRLHHPLTVFLPRARPSVSSILCPLSLESPLQPPACQHHSHRPSRVPPPPAGAVSSLVTAHRPREGGHSLAVSAPTALSADLWTNSSCVNISHETRFSFRLLSLKSATSLVDLAWWYL